MDSAAGNLAACAQFALFAAAPLTAFGSLVLLALYRSRVVRLMKETADSDAPAPEVVRTRTALMAGPALGIRADAFAAHAHPQTRFAVVAEIVAGAAAAAILSVSLVSANGGSVVAGLAVWLTYVWPAFLAAALLTPFGWRDLWGPVLGYVLAYSAVVVYAVSNRPEVSVGFFATSWLLLSGLITVAAVATIARPIRAVGPLLFVVFATCVFGVISAVMSAGLALNRADPQILPLAAAWYRLGLPLALLPLLFAAPALIVCGVSSLIALLVARSVYLRKWQSDSSLAIDSIWFTATAVWALDASRKLGGTAFLLALAAFASHRLIVTLLWRWARHRYAPSGARAPRLLFLRAFAQGKRRERLLHAVSQRWRYVGTIQMIAGPDLATTSIEPHELMGFLFGQLRRRFLANPAELEHALSMLDELPDPDGRYRTTEFFCRDAVWRYGFRRILADTDLVLVDVRGLTGASEGIRFELEQLRTLISPEQVLLLVDSDTDSQLLAATFGSDVLGARAPLAARTRPLEPLMASGNLRRDAATVVERLVAMATGLATAGPLR